MGSMDLADLQYEPEGQFLDRKRASISPQRVAQYISAFANGLGGRLILGVEDDGGITGFKFPGSVPLTEYLAAPRCFLREQPTLSITRVPCRNFRGETDEILVFQVTPYRKGVVTLLDGSGYLRVADATRKINGTLLAELKKYWANRTEK